MTHYRQCKLQKGVAVTTSWIAERFAKKGKYLKLKMGNEWIDGWLVMEVGATRQPEEFVVARSQDYGHQREVSDIQRRSSERARDDGGGVHQMWGDEVGRTQTVC
jgi:hypothetical protein